MLLFSLFVHLFDYFFFSRRCLAEFEFPLFHFFYYYFFFFQIFFLFISLFSMSLAMNATTLLDEP
jgi:hypothetical protein